jgi:hypothetical protein
MRKTVLWSTFIEARSMIDDLIASEAPLKSTLEHALKELNELNTQVHEKDALIQRLKDRRESVDQVPENSVLRSEKPAYADVDTPVQMDMEEKTPEKTREELKKVDKGHLRDESKKERCHGCYVTHWPKHCLARLQNCYNCYEMGHFAAYCELHGGAQKTRRGQLSV